MVVIISIHWTRSCVGIWGQGYYWHVLSVHTPARRRKEFHASQHETSSPCFSSLPPSLLTPQWCARPEYPLTETRSSRVARLSTSPGGPELSVDGRAASPASAWQAWYHHLCKIWNKLRDHGPKILRTSFLSHFRADWHSPSTTIWRGPPLALHSKARSRSTVRYLFPYAASSDRNWEPSSAPQWRRGALTRGFDEVSVSLSEPARYYGLARVQSLYSLQVRTNINASWLASEKFKWNYMSSSSAATWHIFDEEDCLFLQM